MAASIPHIDTLAELGRIAPDVFLFRYDNYVSLFITTDEGVILIDPIGERAPRAPMLIKESVASVTDQPVRYVLYSHAATDHSTGGAIFRDTARFVGHIRTAEKMKRNNDPHSPPPDITFADRHTVEAGGKRVDMYFADLSSTDDYVVIHYPAARLVMFVDLVQPQNIPFRTLLGHPDRIISRLEWVASNLDFDIIVSGHATPQMVGTKADVLEQRDYIAALSAAIGAAQARGAQDNSPEMLSAVRAALEPAYGGWRRFDEFLALNIEGMLRWRAEGP